MPDASLHAPAGTSSSTSDQKAIARNEVVAEASSSRPRLKELSAMKKPLPPLPARFASPGPMKRKTMSTDDAMALRSQPKLTSNSWRRVKSHLNVDLDRSTRSVPPLWQGLPSELVFKILGMLSLPDLKKLVKADPRMRPFLHEPAFASWRKQLACVLSKERQYDETVSSQESNMFARDLNGEQAQEASKRTERKQQDGTSSDSNEVIESAFLAEYSSALRALHLKAAPLNLNNLTTCINEVWKQDRHCLKLRKFGRDFELGRRSAESLFREVNHSTAVECLSFLRLYLTIVRISRAFAQDHVPLQTIRCLDYDCRTAISTYFGVPNQPEPNAPPFVLTDEQARFVQHDVRPGDLVKVQAFAGTGKTRSLLAYAERRPKQKFLYIAFNLSAADSARARFPRNVDCRTMHSVAWREATRAPNQPVGDLRARDVVRILGSRLPEGRTVRSVGQCSTGGQDDKLTPTAVATYVLGTLSRFFYSDDATVIPVKHVPRKVASETDLQLRSVARCAQELWDMIREGANDKGNQPIRCPHDGYVKLLQLQKPHHLETFFAGYDVLLLDEAQDLSSAQVSILLRAKKHCGILAVGDVFQKIYGFRGGTASVFNDQLHPASASFQLTRSFRFGDAVAKLATEMLALRKPAPWETATRKPVLTGAAGRADRVFAEAHLLIKRDRSEDVPDPDEEGQEGRQAIALQTESIATIGETDEIFTHTRIFRSNRKLCLTALALSASLPVLHKIFLKTSQALQPDSIVQLLRDAHILYHNDTRSMSKNSLLRDFASWKDLVQRVEAEGGESKLSLAVALGSLLASSDFLDQVANLETRFCRTEDEATVVLTTVHQAKGLEWDCVLVEDDFRPSLGVGPSKRVEVAGLWAQDELNHLYVALTRAKKHLIVSRSVVQWIAAIRGLYRYTLTLKKEACPLCKSAKHPIVVKQFRLPAFDFLNPRCNENDGASNTDPIDPLSIPLLSQIQGCLSCLSAKGEDVENTDLAHFVSSAAQVIDVDTKPDAAKHEFLVAKHRGMTWAVMHHEYTRAVHSWLL